MCAYVRVCACACVCVCVCVRVVAVVVVVGERAILIGEGRQKGGKDQFEGVQVLSNSKCSKSFDSSGSTNHLFQASNVASLNNANPRRVSVV